MIMCVSLLFLANFSQHIYTSSKLLCLHPFLERTSPTILSLMNTFQLPFVSARHTHIMCVVHLWMRLACPKIRLTSSSHRKAKNIPQSCTHCLDCTIWPTVLARVLKRRQANKEWDRRRSWADKKSYRGRQELTSRDVVPWKMYKWEGVVATALLQAQKHTLEFMRSLSPSALH
jgi:hypothetical protein